MNTPAQFSWNDIRELLKFKPRQPAALRVPSQVGQKKSPFHLCDTCRKTEVSDPDMDFRYCMECGLGFCPSHMGEHKHPSA